MDGVATGNRGEGQLEPLCDLNVIHKKKNTVQFHRKFIGTTCSSSQVKSWLLPLS